MPSYKPSRAQRTSRSSGFSTVIQRSYQTKRHTRPRFASVFRRLSGAQKKRNELLMSFCGGFQARHKTLKLARVETEHRPPEHRLAAGNGYRGSALLSIGSIAFCLLFAGTAAATIAFRSTPAKAAAYLKTTYHAADTVRLATAQQNLQRDQAAGLPATDPRVIRDQAAVDAAKTSANVDKANCAGVGKPVRRQYGRFHCTAHLIGSGEYASDGFSASVKLTLTPRGSVFGMASGWR